MTTDRHVNAIAGRLSLRAPQRTSLEILARVAEIASPRKDADAAEALRVISSEYPDVTDFERDFPSLCFALATGVGKTRLMGAFIAYLYRAKEIRHFFVLAPNLTIYNKLIADFTQGNPKYVLKGIEEFATNPPLIITGDDYDAGHATRTQTSMFDDVHINIFNIAKINAEVRGGKSPRIKRLAECIGQSYFDYLAGLDDLVLIMDESHRYRAKQGVRVLNELKPILGLELTATPQVEDGSKAPIPFRNVIHRYPLANAIKDGFVKKPAVGTRQNFKAEDYKGEKHKERLELLKLEDGIHIHEATKVELETYARNLGLPIVKPFMLVVAEDTSHAERLKELIKSERFFEGRYKDRVITVHSNQSGEEKEETIQALLAVESPDEPTEIVIHVNMLKEGWDVTNLYTIVPLRKADSRTLVEQSIGRGLRLPYGKLTGVTALDRLTIVAHDRFQEIVDEANRPGSAIHMDVVYIDRDIPQERRQSVEVRSIVDTILAPATTEPATIGGTPPTSPMVPIFTQTTIAFETPADQQVARIALEVVQKYEKLPRSKDLRKPEVQAEIIREVSERFTAGQQTLEGVVDQPDIATVVGKATEIIIERTIDIPRIVVVPSGEVTSGFRDFDIDTRSIHYQPVEQDILIEELQSHVRETLSSYGNVVEEERLEDYIVRVLVDCDDISYDEHADLLYKLAGQVVAHLRSYLKNEAEVKNVLQFNQRHLGDLVHAQMQDHYWEDLAGSQVHATKGFQNIRPSNYSIPFGEKTRDFRSPVDDKQYIRGMLFGGFQRCLYSAQKFDSDTERRFAVLLEDEKQVERWLRPATNQIQISYRLGHVESDYEPDFIVETKTEKLLCEIKRSSEVDAPAVQAKAKAAVVWCTRASAHEQQNEGKPWTYLLIPDTAVSATATLSALRAQHAMAATEMRS